MPENKAQGKAMSPLTETSLPSTGGIDSLSRTMRKPRALESQNAEAGVVQDGMTDETGGQSGSIGQQFLWREIVAEMKNETVSAVVSRRTKEAGNNHASRDGSAYF